MLGSRIRRGIFDNPDPFGLQRPMPQPLQMPLPQEPQQRFWQGGDKFTARDGIAGVLAAIGDALANQAGMSGGGVQNLAQGRMSAIDMVRRQQEDAAARSAAMADYRGKKQIDQEFAGPGEPPSAVQVAQWYMSASPEERAAYDATNPIITHGQGSTMIPRSALPTGVEPGAIEDGYRFKGGDPADSNNWEPVGGPTPRASGGFRPRL